MSERLRVRQEFMARLQAEQQRRAAMQKADRSQMPVGLRGRDPYTRSHQPLPRFQGGHVFSGAEELTKRFGEHYAGKFRNWATGGKNPMRPGDPVLSMIAGGGPPGGTYDVPPGGFYGEPGEQAEEGEKDREWQMVPLTMPGKRPPPPPPVQRIPVPSEAPSPINLKPESLRKPRDVLLHRLRLERDMDVRKKVDPKKMARDAFLRSLRKMPFEDVSHLSPTSRVLDSSGVEWDIKGTPRQEMQKLKMRDMLYGPDLPGEIPKKGSPPGGRGVGPFLRSERERKWMNELKQKIKGIYPPGKSPMENMESIKADEPSKMRKITGAIKGELGKGVKGMGKLGPTALQLLFLSQMGKSRGPNPYRGQRESAQKYGQPF
jgi:hypothetical protein